METMAEGGSVMATKDLTMVGVGLTMGLER